MSMTKSRKIASRVQKNLLDHNHMFTVDEIEKVTVRFLKNNNQKIAGEETNWDDLVREVTDNLLNVVPSETDRSISYPTFLISHQDTARLIALISKSATLVTNWDEETNQVAFNVIGSLAQELENCGSEQTCVLRQATVFELHLLVTKVASLNAQLGTSPDSLMWTNRLLEIYRECFSRATISEGQGSTFVVGFQDFPM